MPYSHCLQDWMLIRGGAGITVVQEAATWLDVSAFQSVVPYIEVSASTGSPTLTLQTSPTEEEAFFQTMKGLGPTGGAATASYVLGSTPVGGDIFGWPNNFASDIPPMRFLRWRLTGASSWGATLRIWLNLLQGRGAAFSDAVFPLPREARVHADDHALRAQDLLKIRAAARSGCEMAQGVLRGGTAVAELSLGVEVLLAPVNALVVNVSQDSEEDTEPQRRHATVPSVGDPLSYLEQPGRI